MNSLDQIMMSNRARQEEIFLNTTEVGELIRRSPGAVRNLVMRRKIPYRKPGGRLVFLKSEIEQWIVLSPGLSLEDLKNEELSQE